MVDARSHKSVAELLLDAARQDQIACALLATGAGVEDALVGFHAQQAVEKSIKAVLSVHGVEFRRTHDVLALLDALQEKGLSVPPGSDWFDELHPYAVEARYGMLLPSGLDRGHTLRVVQQVIAWADAELAHARPSGHRSAP